MCNVVLLCFHSQTEKRSYNYSATKVVLSFRGRKKKDGFARSFTHNYKIIKMDGAAALISLFFVHYEVFRVVLCLGKKMEAKKRWV